MRLAALLALVPLCWPAAIAGGPPPPAGGWACVTLREEAVAPGVRWVRQNCSAQGGALWRAGPLVFNVVYADLSRPGVRAAPARAGNGSALLPLPAIAAQSAAYVAGVNGGYFFRIDEEHFFDNVCVGKTRAEAVRPPTPGHANYGVGDGVLKIGGETLSANCDCIGYSRPAVFVANGSASSIRILRRGEAVGADVTDCIGAGPGLVSGGEVAIPKGDDNVNIVEHAANTAVALSGDGTLMLVTSDGRDGCPAGQPCGVNAFAMAHFCRDHLGAAQAMGMDQGGSTTMWIKGRGVVSDSGGGPRNIFDGLFVSVDPGA